MVQSLLNMPLLKNSEGRPEIARVLPGAAIPGGEFQIYGKNFVRADRPRVTVGDMLPRW